LFENIGLGLTKMYNQFHNSLLHRCPIYQTCLHAPLKRYRSITEGILNLWKHLQSTSGIVRCEAVEAFTSEAIACTNGPAVLSAYGWTKIVLTAQHWPPSRFLWGRLFTWEWPHSFTIHPDARREILKRLLLLNHRIHEEEVKADCIQS